MTIPSRIRPTAAAATVCAALVGLVAWTPAAGAANLVKISVSAGDYPASSTSVPYIVGRRLGVFATEGLEIEKLSGSGGGGQTVRNVISGQLSFGDVSTAAAATAFMKGEKIVMIGGAIRSGSDVYYIAKKGSPVKSIQDLRGKTVGFTSAGSVTQAMLQLALQKAGALDSAATVVPVFLRNPEPYQVVFNANDYVPAFQQTVLITQRSYMAENPDTVRRFLRAYKASVEYAYSHPQEAAEAWAAEADTEVKATRPAMDLYVKANQWSVGFDLDGLQTVTDSMRAQGTVKADQQIPWANMIQQDDLPDGVPRIDPKQVH